MEEQAGVRTVNVASVSALIASENVECDSISTVLIDYPYAFRYLPLNEYQNQSGEYTR